MTTLPRSAPARASIALLAGCLLVSGYLTVALRSQVDPVANVVSDYVFYRPGLLVAAVLLLVCAGVAALVGLARLGVPRSRPVLVLSGLWCAGLLLCAVFPTNRVSGESSFSGDVHRLAGATFLTSLPLAAWHLARALRADRRLRPRADRLRTLAITGLGLAAVFGLCQLAPTAMGAVQGLAERLALGAEVALLLTTATTVEQVTR
ncbi:DUF998 domain-containing protein [Actinosynnema sp. NPDC020468]|uniref:DUF998 domain-containing protein n=1 Tax=Actinosynnema sp. NPDC020468 TaxID=3154488 RepID=UPI0033FA12DE